MKSFSTQSSVNNQPTRYSQCLALEARLVFDGAGVATAVEAQNTSNNESNTAEHTSVVAAVPNEPPPVNFLPETTPHTVDYVPNVDTKNTQPEFFTAINPVDLAFTPNTVTEQASAIMVVDPRADNAAWLSLNPPVNTQVMVLDIARDGFQQVAELLQTRHDVTELHILPWTQNHQQWLGSQSLTATLEPSVSSSLMDWNDGLADHATLVFHGQDNMGTGWLNHLSALTNTESSWSRDTDFSQNTSTPAVNSSSAINLIFIDSAVQNANDIISAANPNAEIIYLNANQDGLTQIADYLEGRTGIDSIQIISHAKDASLYLGNESINNDNLASHAEQLATIGQALTVNGDILLYGCELAKSAEGSQFVDHFSYLTQADVAASIDNTGATSKGGNWALEYSTGTIEASLLAANDYQALLAGVATSITSVAITSNAGPDNSYTIGEVVTASVVFSNIETVIGTPTLMLNVGGQLRAATYVSGSGSNTLVFNYTIVAGDNDANGISINANSLARNGGAINNIDFAATLYHPLIADNNLQQVTTPLNADVTAPVLQSAVAHGTNLTLTYNEIGSGLLTGGVPLINNFAVTRNGGTPIAVTAVSVDRLAGTVNLTLGSTINATDTGMQISYTASNNALDIQDSAGNRAANLSNQAVDNAMPSFDLKNGSLLFNDPTPVVVNGAVGTGGQSVNDVVIFNNAVTLNGQVIDVVATTVANTNVTIAGFDSASGFLATSIDPNWFELNTNVTAGGSSTIKFDFIKHGTYTVGTGGVNVLLKNVAVNSYDLDSGQFQDFDGFSSYTVASDTNLVQTNLANNFVRFENNPPIPDASPLGSATFDRFRVTALYTEINSFQLRVGSTINTPGYYFLDFSGGPSWNTPITYDVPTVNPLTTSNITPTLTGTYTPRVNGSTDTAQSLTVTVNNVTYTLGNGLTWQPNGTWSLIIPPTNPLPIGTYEVLVDTGYGPIINTHTQDITHNELTITNSPPVNTVPSTQTLNGGVPTPIAGLSATDINGNLASTRLSVAGGVINVDLTGGATISTGGNGTNTLTLLGTQAQINAALATVNYTANNGTSNDTLTILSTDSLGLTDTDNVTINVNTAPPVTVNDSKTGIGGTPITVDVLNNDSDPDGNLDKTSVQIVGAAPDGTLSVANQGTWSVNPSTGEIIFTPIVGFTLSPTPISYTVKDTGGLISTAATVTLTMINPPLAIPDTGTGIGGKPITVNVLNNDSDPDGNLDKTSVQIVGAAPDGTLNVANQGTWSVNPSTGEITFTPIAGFTGSPTPISYTVKDTSGLISSAASVTLTMTNLLPIASADINTANEGGATITGDIITNEFTLGDQPTLVTAANQGGNTINIGSPFITAASGVLILNADGSYSYKPPLKVANDGLIERFNYTITDANGDTSSSILTIFVRPTLGTSGSLIQLSNPPAAIIADATNFFVAPPLQSVTTIDLSLYDTHPYIPSRDGIISLTGSLRDQIVLELQRFSFDIPSWSFQHTNPNEQLDFEASRPDGTSLPDWLRFNPKLLRFSGVPPKGVNNEVVMVTARDSYGNEVHALFTVHVNKERARFEHKPLSIDLKLMGIPDKAIEKRQHQEKSATVGKSGLSERLHAVGKLGKLQESRELLNSLRH